MARLILWAILIVLLVRALSRLMRGVLHGAGYRKDGGETPGVPLVKDPVCGIFIPRSRALTAGSGDRMQFFCSEKCRREWMR